MSTATSTSTSIPTTPSLTNKSTHTHDIPSAPSQYTSEQQQQQQHPTLTKQISNDDTDDGTNVNKMNKQVYVDGINPLLTQGFDGVGVYTHAGYEICHVGQNLHTVNHTWHVYPDEVRSLVMGLSNTNEILLQRTSEEEEILTASYRNACHGHIIPDLISYVVEYLKECPSFHQDMGRHGVHVNGLSYRYTRGCPLDFILALRPKQLTIAAYHTNYEHLMIAYRTHHTIIIALRTIQPWDAPNFTVAMGKIVDQIKKKEKGA